MILFIPFTRALNRSEFSCGKPALDQWLASHAGQQGSKHTSSTTLGVDEKHTRIASYFALSAHRVESSEIAGTRLETTRINPIPAILIGRLAVDKRYQGRGIGKITLVTALQTVAGIAPDVGFEVVVVDAIDDDAAGFYLKYGFSRLTEGSRRLFLTTKDLLATVASDQAGPS